jgi:hypothetical protein
MAYLARSNIYLRAISMGNEGLNMLDLRVAVVCNSIAILIILWYIMQ